MRRRRKIEVLENMVLDILSKNKEKEIGRASCRERV